MRRKIYEKPQIRVHQMRQRAQLLAGSEVNASMSGTFEEEDW